MRNSAIIKRYEGKTVKSIDFIFSEVDTSESIKNDEPSSVIFTFTDGSFFEIHARSNDWGGTEHLKVGVNL